MVAQSQSKGSRMKKLPASVQEIADVIGRERALLLVGQLPRAYDARHPGGQPILYVPKSLRADHPLVRMIGFNDAAKMVRAFGGEILYPRNCRDIYRSFRDSSIDAMLAAGGSPASIAELMGVSERLVRNRARMEISQEARRKADNDNAPTMKAKARA